MAWELDFEQDKRKKGPVLCLGMVFESEEARRAYFTEELKNKLPELKHIEGFPKGRDEDILALSDPPYYTACPNPFLPQIVEEWEQERPQNDDDEPYLREPYAADVSEGKNDPIYNAHSYHTKVPHKAIMRYILHYTNPGDIVFDGFAGTGMTGVAAQLCGDRKTVESLGYRVEEDGTILSNEDDETVWKPISKIGVRHAILNDLSPAASFIAYNYNTPTDPELFQEQAKQVLLEVEKECGWMYATLPSYATEEQREQALAALHNNPQSILEDTSLPWGKINYTVWSDVFVCPNCSQEIIFWDAAVDKEQGKVRDEFLCPSCGVQLTKKKLERAWVTEYDDAIHETVRHAKQVPVLINYSIGKRRDDKIPDTFDWALLTAINMQPIPYWFPTDPIPKGDKTGEPLRIGITHVHQFYTKRNLILLMATATPCEHSKINPAIPCFWITSSMIRTSKLYKFTLDRKMGTVSGTLYLPSLRTENSSLKLLRSKMNDISLPACLRKRSVANATTSLSGLSVFSNMVDYIFLDPPFGSNIMYSELNFLWEAWLKVFTNNGPEAIVNATQKKTLEDYQKLMTKSFEAAYRMLKPGRWMTVEFSNTKTAVWNAITQAIQQAGFVIANVSALNKQQGSFNSVTTTTAVKQDLVISAYKPSETMNDEMEATVGQSAGIWTFVDEHLRHLPVFVGKRGQAQVIEERRPRNIYDRLVAYYVSRGWPLPILTSGDFQSELVRRYPRLRDGMVFMEDQVAEYDQKKILVKELLQADLFVSNESTAIEWIRQRLVSKPQAYHDLQPGFMKSIQHLDKYEKLPELVELLEQNFLRYDGEDEMPEQIVSYLRANYHNFRGTEVTREMRQKAKGFWYVPDPRKAADLEKLRERDLWREFEHYLEEATRSKRLKSCRSEALKAGFKRLWMEQKYAEVVLVGDKLPPAMIQEDIFLSQFINNAKSLMR